MKIDGIATPGSMEFLSIPNIGAMTSVFFESLFSPPRGVFHYRLLYHLPEVDRQAAHVREQIQ